MAYKCRICGTNEVEHLGDVCDLCAIGQDPYVAAMQGNVVDGSSFGQSIYRDDESTIEAKPVYSSGKGKRRKVLLGGGASVSNVDPYGNSIVPQQDDSVQVYQAGQVPTSSTSVNQSMVIGTQNIGTGTAKSNKKNKPLTTGITKNISVDKQDKSFFEKIFRSLFHGIPYTLNDDVMMFQVFPDFSGTSLNAMGNACDQVMIYGKLNNGAVSENNDVEIYGRRDSNNNIIAKEIHNKATGTTIVPEGIIPSAVIWGIFVGIICLIAYIAMAISGTLGGAVAGIGAGLSSLATSLRTAFITTTVIWAVVMCFARNKFRGKKKWYLYIGMFVLIMLFRFV